MFEIWNEDCLEGMKRIADGTVDAIICDLPYGTTDCPFDKRLPFEPMWKEFLRVCKLNAAIVLFSQMPFGAELIMSQKKFFRYKWVWHKSLGVGFLNAKKMPLRCHEDILVFYRRLPTYNPQFTKGKPRRGYNPCKSQNYGKKHGVMIENDGEHYYPRDVQYFKLGLGGRENISPQQKTVDLLEYLIRTYTNEGELVLDATMGSGSTGVACMNLGRKFIGFELEKNYYESARRRIESALSQKRQELF